MAMGVGHALRRLDALRTGRNVLHREVTKDGDTSNMPRPAAIEVWTRNII